MFELTAGNSVRWWPTRRGEEYDGSDTVDAEGQSTRHARLGPATWLVWVRNQARRAQWLHYARLYGGVEESTATPIGIDPSAQVFMPASLPYNLVRSGVDTLTAKVCKSRPLPTYLPVGGDHRVHKRVRLLNRFVNGLFYRNTIHKRSRTVARDAALYGKGMMLIQPDRKKVACELLFPWEVYVDPVDARYGEPRSLYLVRYLDKDLLKARFPRHEDAIESAPVLDESFLPIQDVFAVTARCTVIEAWHLPAIPGVTKDGRHTICLLDETLLDEQYDDPDFPIASLVKTSPVSGWWGLGLGDEMSGYQDEKNVMAERVSYAHRIVPGQMWLVPDSGGIYDTDFNDDIGVIIRCQGGKDQLPVCVNPEPLNPQTYQYFHDIDRDAYGYTGISLTSAQSQRPAGVTAALAIQTLDDIETDRFTLFERDYEDFHGEVARLMLRSVRKIAERYGDFRVFTANKGAGQEIMWKRDVDLPEDSFVLQQWPQSILPKTPAARLQKVIELSANGTYDRAQTLKELGTPDNEAEERLLLAPRETAEAQIYHMLECECPRGATGYLPPGKFQDLTYSLTRASQEYNLLQADAIDRGTIGDPDIIARLANLSKYSQACSDLLEEAKQKALQQQAQLAMAANGGIQGAGPQPAPIQPAQPAPQPM